MSYKKNIWLIALQTRVVCDGKHMKRKKKSFQTIHLTEQNLIANAYNLISINLTY